MGLSGEKIFKTLTVTLSTIKSRPNLFKSPLHFRLNNLHKVAFWGFSKQWRFQILWNFEFLTWESMGKSRKRLIVERNGWEFITRGSILRTDYIVYVSCQVIWVQFGVIRCTLKISEDFQNVTSPTNRFWMFWNLAWSFVSMILTKLTFFDCWNFCILNFNIFFFFFVSLNMGLYGRYISKTLFLPQNVTKCF